MLLRLHIKNYTPLAEKGVKEIILEPVHLFNVLLARNGYGKTSLLREANPFPPDNADYNEGGYKCIEYKLNNNHYKLESWTGKKSVHYFYYNGENLNKGKTSTVQKELVKAHFNVTNDIKNVLSGLDKCDVFSSMVPQRRKQILMEINPNDTSYALKIYDKFKSKHNQIKGALKHQRQRLVSENRRQEDLNLLPVDELNYEIKSLDEQIKNALLLHGELLYVRDPDVEEQVKKLRHLVAGMMNCDRKSILPPSYWYSIKERFTARLDGAIFNKNHTEALIHKITDQLNDITPDLDTNIDGYRQKIDDLGAILSDLTAKRGTLLEEIESEPFFKDNEYHVQSIVKEIPSVIDHITNIEVTSDETMFASLFLSLVESEKRLGVEISELENNVREIRHRLDHFKSTDEIKCPECNTLFRPGFDTLNPAELEIALKKGTANVEQLTAKREGIRKRIENNESWYYGMLSFTRYIKNTQNVDFFSSLIKHYNVGKKNPYRLVRTLELIVEQAEIWEDIKIKEAERKTLVAQYRLLNCDNIKFLHAELDELNMSLSETQKGIKWYISVIKNCDKNINIIQAEHLSRDALIECFDEVMGLLEEKGKYIIKQSVEQRINELTPRKNALVTKLIRSQSLVSVIEDIEEQVSLLESKEKHLSFLLDKLSPTKGMIGDFMLEFLNSLCANTNAVIERIWSDPLKLQSPRIDEENKDLDYKFSVVTTNPLKPISDIKKCSGGEKDIIDFALRYTLMRYTKGRTGVPLCLDEIGASFDELHKKSYSNYIATERRSGRLPQTFLISHFVTQYGAFNPNEANVIKLNTEGLIMPEGGNENVLIK